MDKNSPYSEKNKTKQPGLIIESFKVFAAPKLSILLYKLHDLDATKTLTAVSIDAP